MHLPSAERRAKILRDGQLSLTVYGEPERLLWARRVLVFCETVRRVLGDRRQREPWGGSVLDSLVGVLLTQNVADHLSSSAFLRIVARWPGKGFGGAKGGASDASTNGTDDAAVGHGKGGLPAAFARRALPAALDMVDWHAVRTAPIGELQRAIECRGMHEMLSERIKAILEIVSRANRDRAEGKEPEAIRLAKEAREAIEQGTIGGAWGDRTMVQNAVNDSKARNGADPGEVDADKAADVTTTDTPNQTATDEEPLLPSSTPPPTKLESEVATLGSASGSGSGTEAIEVEREAPSTESHVAVDHALTKPPVARRRQALPDVEDLVSGAEASPELPRGRISTRSSARLRAVDRPTGPASPMAPSRPLKGKTHASSVSLEASRACSPPRVRRTPFQEPSPDVSRGAESSAERSLEPELIDQACPKPLASAKVAPEPPSPPRSATDAESILEAAPSQTASKPTEDLSLEWLRTHDPTEATDFLLGIPGVGYKSVACLTLLTLQRPEFPVDVNVGRIAARLGWIPLDAEAGVEDLDEYAPEPEVHRFLRERLGEFGVAQLYELHYQLITLGKVFCHKAEPNCAACPLREACEYAQHRRTPEERAVIRAARVAALERRRREEEEAEAERDRALEAEEISVDATVDKARVKNEFGAWTTGVDAHNRVTLEADGELTRHGETPAEVAEGMRALSTEGRTNHVAASFPFPKPSPGDGTVLKRHLDAQSRPARSACLHLEVEQRLSLAHSPGPHHHPLRSRKQRRRRRAETLLALSADAIRPFLPDRAYICSDEEDDLEGPQPAALATSSPLFAWHPPKRTARTAVKASLATARAADALLADLRRSAQVDAILGMRAWRSRDGTRSGGGRPKREADEGTSNGIRRSVGEGGWLASREDVAAPEMAQETLTTDANAVECKSVGTALEAPARGGPGQCAYSRRPYAGADTKSHSESDARRNDPPAVLGNQKSDGCGAHASALTSSPSSAPAGSSPTASFYSASSASETPDGSSRPGSALAHREPCSTSPASSEPHSSPSSASPSSTPSGPDTPEANEEALCARSSASLGSSSAAVAEFRSLRGDSRPGARGQLQRSRAEDSFPEASLSTPKHRSILADNRSALPSSGAECIKPVEKTKPLETPDLTSDPSTNSFSDADQGGPGTTDRAPVQNLDRSGAFTFVASPAIPTLSASLPQAIAGPLPSLVESPAPAASPVAPRREAPWIGLLDTARHLTALLETWAACGRLGAPPPEAARLALELLGVTAPSSAKGELPSLAQLGSCFRRLVAKTHPDRCPDSRAHEVFRAAVQALAVAKERTLNVRVEEVEGAEESEKQEGALRQDVGADGLRERSMAEERRNEGRTVVAGLGELAPCPDASPGESCPSCNDRGAASSLLPFAGVAPHPSAIFPASAVPTVALAPRVVPQSSSVSTLSVLPPAPPPPTVKMHAEVRALNERQLDGGWGLPLWVQAKIEAHLEKAGGRIVAGEAAAAETKPATEQDLVGGDGHGGSATLARPARSDAKADDTSRPASFSSPSGRDSSFEASLIPRPISRRLRHVRLVALKLPLSELGHAVPSYSYAAAAAQAGAACVSDVVLFLPLERGRARRMRSVPITPRERAELEERQARQEKAAGPEGGEGVAVGNGGDGESARDRATNVGEEGPRSDDASSQSRPDTVSGIVFIPMRQVLHGCFPLDGTYFQINEVVMDASDDARGIEVPEETLRDRVGVDVYLGSSIHYLSRVRRLPGGWRGVKRKGRAARFGNHRIATFGSRERSPSAARPVVIVTPPMIVLQAVLRPCSPPAVLAAALLRALRALIFFGAHLCPSLPFLHLLTSVSYLCVAEHVARGGDEHVSDRPRVLSRVGPGHRRAKLAASRAAALCGERRRSCAHRGQVSASAPGRRRCGGRRRCAWTFGALRGVASCGGAASSASARRPRGFWPPPQATGTTSSAVLGGNAGGRLSASRPTLSLARRGSSLWHVSHL